MQTTKNMTFHACTCIVRLQVLICYVNTHLQNVNKTSGFECCFWSTQSVERQARTSDNVKTGVFISLNVQWWSFIDNVVYCNILRSIKAAFFEIEKAMFTGVTLLFQCLPSSLLALILTVNNQSHLMLNVTWRYIVRKIGWITGSDCKSVTDFNQTVRYICHVVDVCSQFHKDFHESCLFNLSDQLAVGIVFSCFWLKNYKNILLRYSMTFKQYFCVEESLS